MKFSERNLPASSSPKSFPTPTLAVSLAALATAVAAAVLLPGNRMGLAVVLVALAGAVCLVIASPATDRVTFAGCLALALVLSASAVYLAAEWVVVINLIAATGLALVAVTGSRSWMDLVSAPLSAGLRAGRSIGFVLRPLGSRIPSRNAKSALQTAAGLAIGALLVVVFGALFLSADKAFGEIAGGFFEGWDLGLLPLRLFVLLFTLVGAGVLILVGAKYAGIPSYLVNLLTTISNRRPQVAKRTWMLALGLLDALFLVFATFQLVVFFAGNEFVLETAGLTYAEYARSGFFQLLAVCILAIGVVVIAYAFSDASTPRGKAMLGVFAGVLMASCLVVCASAVRRMQLYEQAFGFSQARLVAHALLFWIGGLLIIGLVAIGLRRAGWVPAATVLLTAVSLVVFTGLNPDRLVARHNVDRFEKTGKFDAYYLGTLGPDAAPELMRLPESLRECALRSFGGDELDEDSWASFNLGREQARSALKERRLVLNGSGGYCGD